MKDEQIEKVFFDALKKTNSRNLWRDLTREKGAYSIDVPNTDALLFVRNVIEAAKAASTAAQPVEALARVIKSVPAFNMNGYDDDDVRRLHDWAVSVVHLTKQAAQPVDAMQKCDLTKYAPLTYSNSTVFPHMVTMGENGKVQAVLCPKCKSSDLRPSDQESVYFICGKCQHIEPHPDATEDAAQPVDMTDEEFTEMKRSMLAAADSVIERRQLAKAMADRFLGWKLPKTFSPDAGITFSPPSQPHCWPTGTNLLNADDAKAMFLYCLGEQAAQPVDALARVIKSVPAFNMNGYDEDDVRRLHDWAVSVVHLATKPVDALVAAAPDLLLALQGVLRVADRATVEFDAARAAIAKATAQPVEEAK